MKDITLNIRRFDDVEMGMKVNIGADTRDFIQEIKNVRSELERMGETVEKSSSVVGKSYAYQGNQLKGLRNAIKNIQKEYNNLRDTAKKYYGTKYTTNTFEGSTTKKINNAIFSQNKKGLQNYESINDPARLTSLLEQVTKDFNSLFSDVQNQLTSQGKKANQELEKEIINTEKLNAKLKETPQSVEKTETAISRFAKRIKEINKMQNGVSTGFSNIINRFKSAMVTLRLIGTAIKSTWNQISSMVEEATAYTESLNLYTVALGEYAEQGRKWADKISNALYLDPNNIMQYTGALFNLTRGLGVASDDAYIMSTNLTQLAYDMSSYLNIDVESGYTKLQSAMTGQSRAVASAGVALQVASLQQLAYSMGIKKSVSDMTQAEKTYLRYIQIMRSTSNMQGDLARTIITPANAIRVLKNQFTLLSRAVGNIFVPIIMKAIPYVMALTKVLQDLAARIASFLGVKIGWSSTEIDYSGLKLADTYLEDVGDTAKSTGSKIKKAADELGNLANFDELNVITFNDDTGYGSGGRAGSGGGGSVLPRLQEEIDGYDMLAGLTSQFDKQVENATKNLDKLKNAIIAIGVAWATWKLLKLTGDLIAFGEKVVSGGEGLTGFGKIASVVWNKLHEGKKPVNDTILYYDTLTHKMKELKKGTIDYTKYQVETMSALKKFGIIAGGIAVTLGSMALEYKNVNKQAIEYMKTGKEMNALIPTLGVAGAAAGGAAVGTMIAPGVGTVIGAVVGGIAGMTSAWKAAKDAITEYNAEMRLFGTLHINEEEWTNMFNTAFDASIRFKTSLDSLNSSIVSHGESAQSALDTLDLLSYKFGITGAKISGEDTTKIMSALRTVTSETTAQIEDSTNKDLLLWKEAFDKGGVMSKDSEEEMLKNIITYGDKRKTEVNNINDNITKIVEGGLKSRGYLTKSEQKQIQDMVEKIRELLKQNMTNAEADMTYYKHHFNDKSNALDKESYKTFMTSYNTFKAERQKTIDDAYTQLLSSAEQYRKDQIESGKKTAEEAQQEFNRNVLEADMYRKKATEQMLTDLDTTRTQVLSNIGEMYISLLNKTDDESIKIREKIENIFSELDINTNEIIQKFGSVGTSVGTTTVVNAKKAWKDGKPEGWFIVGADTTGLASTVNQTMTQLQSKNKSLKIDYTPIYGSRTNLAMTREKLFAEGGYPNSGDLFFANENGVPEYITSIGNKSAVVNQTQMVTALTNAIVQGLSNMNSPQSNEPVNIYIGNDKVYSGFINYAKRQNNIYGTNVIRI